MKPLLLYLSRHRWPALLWTLLIVIACSWPGRSLPKAPVLGFDKVVHVGMLAGWAFLWMLLFPKKNLLLFLVGIAFGIVLEFYQQLLPFDRTFDWWDALADGIGVLLGTLLFWFVSRMALPS